jgi:uncharacterized protein (TIGR03083 family)
MDKQKFVDKIDTTWAAFTATYTGVPADQLTRPGVAGDWSVKDVLAHVTIWEAEALKYLPIVLAGGRPPRYSTLYGGIDAFNAQSMAEKRGLPLDAVRRQLDDTHRQLMDYVRAAPDEQFTRATRFRHRLRLDTYSHYAEHTHTLRAWRERLAAGPALPGEAASSP